MSAENAFGRDFFDIQVGLKIISNLLMQRKNKIFQKNFQKIYILRVFLSFFMSVGERLIFSELEYERECERALGRVRTCGNKLV